MTSLYEITEQHNQALLEMSEMDNLPDEVIQDTMESIAGEFEDKAISVAAFFKNMESDIDSMKSAEKRIADRRKTLQNKISWMKDYLKTNMQRTGITKIECPDFRITLRNNPVSVNIVDPRLIPDEFKIETITFNKSAIKSAGGCGGVELVSGQSIVIK